MIRARTLYANVPHTDYVDGTQPQTYQIEEKTQMRLLIATHVNLQLSRTFITKYVIRDKYSNSSL